MINKSMDYEHDSIEIADGIYWVGYADENRELHCNPYLIVEGGEAVLIDGGNRDDFSSVMLKILRAGVEPSNISRLIYQHYDPDLCGSLPQLEAIIDNKDLKIISHAENNVFIHYYSARTKKLDYRTLGGHFDFATGRRLEFYGTPYCHLPGSFITFDAKTGTLFTSDLFGSFDYKWDLFLELDESCRSTSGRNLASLLDKAEYCHLKGIVRFQETIMTSSKALAYALDVIEGLGARIIAPQHGSIIRGEENIGAVIRLLRSVDHIGIDKVLAEEGK